MTLTCYFPFFFSFKGLQLHWMSRFWLCWCRVVGLRQDVDGEFELVEASLEVPCFVHHMSI